GDGPILHVLFVERLVAAYHLRRHLAHSRIELPSVEELRGDRVERVEALDLPRAEGLLQLVGLAVTRAVADIRTHAQALLPGLPEEQGDVRVVARMEEHVGPHRAELGDE